MASICGVIAEFNPFHNGHAALVQAAKKNGAAVIAVMSGNFVQRGSPAITEKHVRTAAALHGGVDLILELPVAYSTATAQRFAQAAVHLLHSTGVVDTLAFGSECGDVTALQTLADTVDAPYVTSRMREHLKAGITFAKARELAVEEACGSDLAKILASPNNILGMEYLRQAALQNFTVSAMTIARVGAQHHDDNGCGTFASASYVRANAADITLVTQYVPKKAAQIYAKAMVDGLFPADAAKLEPAILSHLRRQNLVDLQTLPDLSEGLENRLYATIRQATSLAQLEQMLKTKRYTMARIRRLILAAFLGVTQQDQNILPPYIRVLGFNARGRQLLTEIKKNSPLPVDTSLARLRAMGGFCASFAAKEALSTDLYAFCLPTPLVCGYEYTASGIFLE